MMRKPCILLAIILLALCFSIVPAAAKEEVVYVNLDAEGDIEGLYVVNIFDAGNATTIVDYGPYTVVKNLVSTDPITKTNTFPDGDHEYTVTYGPGKLYYQGNPEGKAIPWNIAFTFKLDGETVEPEDLAGATGHVTIEMDIGKNPEGDEFFYKNFGMTVTILLDANTCTNIVAPGATFANNGANKQLTYTILPDKGAKETIECDAVKFHMDAVNINGVRLSMDIKPSDVKSENIDDLKKGVHDLTDAAEQLKNGAFTLSSLTSTYLPPTSALNVTISSTSRSIATGANELLNNLIKLNSKVSDIDEKISKQINEVLDPISKNPTSLHSFASLKNQDVGRVQFVIHTKAIEVPEEEYVKEPEKQLNFFERILALFGLA